MKTASVLAVCGVAFAAAGIGWWFGQGGAGSESGMYSQARPEPAATMPPVGGFTQRGADPATASPSARERETRGAAVSASNVEEPLPVLLSDAELRGLYARLPQAFSTGAVTRAKLLRVAAQMRNSTSAAERAYAHAVDCRTGDVDGILSGLAHWESADASLQRTLALETGLARFAPDQAVTPLLGYVDTHDNEAATALAQALVLSGNHESMRWLPAQAASKSAPAWLAPALGEVKAARGSLVPALIEVVGGAGEDNLRRSALDALGSIGTGAAHDWLVIAGAREQMDRTWLVHALARAADPGARGAITQTMLFGSDDAARLLALDAYASGSGWDKAQLRGTLSKIALGEREFPADMVARARILLNPDAGSIGGTGGKQ